jgi:hypothetical protein
MHQPRIVADVGVGQKHTVDPRVALDGRDAVQQPQLIAKVRRGVDDPSLLGDRVHDRDTRHEASARRVLPRLLAAVLAASGLRVAAVLRNTQHHHERIAVTGITTKRRRRGDAQ